MSITLNGAVKILLGNGTEITDGVVGSSIRASVRPVAGEIDQAVTVSMGGRELFAMVIKEKDGKKENTILLLETGLVLEKA